MLERKMKKALLGAAAGAALSVLGAGQASAVTIDGITFPIGAQLDTTTVYENNVNVPGDHLIGIGQVNAITAAGCNAHSGNICWQNGDNGTELTFSFDYILQGSQLIGGGKAVAAFSSGIITFYADSTPDFTPTGGGQANDMIHATDGAQWLNLLGGATGDTCTTLGITTCFSGDAITLVSTFTATGDLNVAGAGDGHGFLDVDTSGIGAANSSYDTNSVTGNHDLSLDTSFNILVPTDYPISGSATLKALTIPEPTTLSLFGMGLLGLGFGAVRRRRKA